MTTEGTYPYGLGGVSVWCDQLIRALPGYDFHLVAIVATGAEPVQWDLPGNVASVVTMPLWGPPTPRRTPSRAAGGVPLPHRLLRDLVGTLIDPSPQGQPRFAAAVREVFHCAQDGALVESLASEKAVRVLSEAWRSRWPPGAERYAPTLHDAVTATQLLSHGLRPLCYPPVRADVAHAATNGLGVLPALTARWRYGTPIVLTEHGVYLREQYLRHTRGPYRWPVKAFHLAFMKRLCALGYAEAATITPGNRYNRRWEERLGADASRIRTVNNGVDPASFPRITTEPETPTLSWVGRIDPIKDLETLLRAFSLVRREMPAARLRLFGSPTAGSEPYLEYCRKLAADLGITDAATFEGRVDDICDAYRAGGVVVLSSISEGFPFSLIEAMTCGRACVATDVGGVAEALGDSGLLVPARSPVPLAQACLTLLRDGGLRRRLGDAARARVLANFTLDAVTGAFDEIYRCAGNGLPLPAAVGPDTANAGTVGPDSVGPDTVETGVVGSGQRADGLPALAGKPVRGDIGEVCARIAGVPESAVDPLEITSALEFDGLSDLAVRQRYGLPDVFALAEVMFSAVPRRPAEPDQAPDPWSAGSARAALHGLLYGLPTVCFPVAMGRLTGPGMLTVLIVAVLASWAASQGLAFAGYARLGRGEAVPAARLLLGGMACAIAVVGATVLAAAAAAGAGSAAFAFGVGLGAYMAGATVLTVLGAERLLLIVLAPAVLGAAVFLVAGQPARLAGAVWPALAATPVLAVGLAAARAGRKAQLRPSPAELWLMLPSPAELWLMLPSAAFGLVAAGLLVFPFAAAGRLGTGGAQVASLPLALSMGTAEWALIWFRRRTQRLVRATTQARAFRARVRVALGTAMLWYLTAAAMLTGAVLAAAAAAGLVRPEPGVLLQVGTYLALGGGLFVALLLQAFGIRHFPLCACAATLAVEVAWRPLGAIGQLVVCASLMLVLVGYAAVVLAHAMRHAY